MHSVKYFQLPKMLINYKGKGSNFTVEKPSRKKFNQAIKVNITIIRHQCHEPFLIMQREGHNTAVVLPKLYNHIPVTKILEKPSGRIIDKINDWYSSKVKRS